MTHNYPQRKGDRFTTNFSDKIYTVREFFYTDKTNDLFDNLDDIISKFGKSALNRVTITTEYGGTVLLKEATIVGLTTNLN
jgi:hypothetical protein